MFQQAVDPANVTPWGRNVLLRRLPMDSQEGLIQTPEDRIEKNLKCEVIAVNRGRQINGKHIPLQFKAGDIVLVRQWRGILLNPFDTSVIFVSDDLVEAIY